MPAILPALGAIGAQVGTTAATAAANEGLGLLFGKARDRRQLKQQGKLQELSIRGSKELTDYNLGKQLELFEKTGYGAQKSQMQRAGFNPALMYGMGGGASGTTATQPGATHEAQATQGGQPAEYMGQLGMQLQLLGAQKRNIEADTENKLADAEKKRGIDTDEAQQRIQALQAGIENTKAQTEIAKIEANLKDMEAAVKEATLEDSIDRIVYEAKQASKQLDIVENEAYISRATKEAKVDIVKQQVIESVLQSVLLRARVKNTEMDTEVKKGQLAKMVADVMNASRQINLNERRLELDEAVKQWETNYPGISQTTGRIFNDIMEELPRIFGSKRPKYGNLETEKRK